MVVSCFLGYLFGTRVRCGDLTGTWVRVTHGEGYGPSRYVWSPPIGWGVGGGWYRGGSGSGTVVGDEVAVFGLGLATITIYLSCLHWLVGR
jgi:hypothetical protein